jgi:preprotein translocase subunit YajC
MKVLFLSLMAHAQQVAQAGAPKQPGAIEMMLPFIFVFAIFYFLVIRPQVKRQKAHHKFISELKKGDEVITSSGILGTIEGLTDRFVTLEVADGVSIKVLRSQVTSTLAQQQEVKN